MSYKTVSLTDLRIRTRNENRNSFNERSVTRSDIEAVVRDLEGVEADTAVFVDGDGRFTLSVSKPGRYLIVPLDTGDTE